MHEIVLQGVKTLAGRLNMPKFSAKTRASKVVCLIDHLGSWCCRLRTKAFLVSFGVSRSGKA